MLHWVIWKGQWLVFLLLEHPKQSNSGLARSSCLTTLSPFEITDQNKHLNPFHPSQCFRNSERRRNLWARRRRRCSGSAPTPTSTTIPKTLTSLLFSIANSIPKSAKLSNAYSLSSLRASTSPTSSLRYYYCTDLSHNSEILHLDRFSVI